MPKLHFRSETAKQLVLFPHRIDEDIAPNDPVRIVDAVVDSLNLEGLFKLYKAFGRSSYHPRVMLKVILYAYMNNIYSCRRIEQALRRDIHFIWLAGYEKPDFITINRFRNRAKDEIGNIFTQLVLLLSQRGLLSLEVEYVDGTKIESKANKYTFVWRKTAERNRRKIQEQVRQVLLQVEDSIIQDKMAGQETIEFTPEQLGELIGDLKDALEREPEPSDGEEKKKVRERKKQIRELEKQHDKLAQYDKYLEQMDGRNSMSKTDPEATFMRMKEDAMNNGQTKPGYNLQITTNGQFITHFGFFPNPTDTFTLIPFMNTFRQHYDRMPETLVADAGYGSEENYRFMEEAGTQAYVKYNRFHLENRPRYQPDPFSQQGMYYNREEDYYVCPMGQHLERIGTAHGRTQSGYVTQVAKYRAQDCSRCPLRCRCYKAATDRRVIEVNHQLNRYKEQASQRLKSEEGIRHRGQRCIEPEAVFGQMKYNMAYRRFRHFGKDKVNMDFAFFATAFNIKKMCAKQAKRGMEDLLALLLAFIYACTAHCKKDMSLQSPRKQKVAA
jgi:transposase